MNHKNSQDQLSCVDSVFEAFECINEKNPLVAQSIQQLLMKDNVCNIIKVNDRNWYTWYRPYEKQNDPYVLERIIDFSKENTHAFHFLYRYYTCIGNSEEANKWILPTN